MSSFTQPQWPSWAYATEVNDPFTAGYPQYNNYSSYLADSMEAYQTHHHHHLVHNHQMSRTTESKPRLSKEEVELLEAEFQKNHKPNSTVKKGLAESMRVDNARINNWFQNRRAREKKERNIREYEARQKLEKDKPQSESGDSPVAQRKSDLVASSAPFPNTQAAPSRSQTGTPDGSSSPASLFQAKETPVSEHSVILPSTELSPQLSPELIAKQEPSYDDATSIQYGQLTNSELLADGELSPNALSDSHEQEFMLSAGGSESGYYMSQLNGSTGAPFQAAGDFQAPLPQKPSQSIDIAARRNRRPPPLAISGSRSHSTGLLKTGVEMGRRLEICNSIRRVASSTGPMRIQKPVGTPRSPFFSRAAGDGLQLRRSPVLGGIKGSNAPPTPDTPVVIATQPMDSTTHPDSDSESSDRFSVPDMAIHDPTLRTPPTTPGVMEGYFSLNAVYDMQMPSDGSLLTPSLATYSNNLDVPNVPMAVPAYIANATGCSSQPVTPSLPALANGGYFGLANANAEYQWPDHSSRNSSPVRGPQQPQFMNMTTSNFSPTDR